MQIGGIDMAKCGRHTYGYQNVRTYFPIDEGIKGATLTIGAFCSLASNISVYLGGEHPTGHVSTYPLPKFLGGQHLVPWHNLSKGNVIIGNDVWIGDNVTIMGGVTIADGAIIGANSTVASDVGPYEIWIGNPARCLKKRFTDEQIEALLKIAWWNWPDEKIIPDIDLICSEQVDEFIYKHLKGMPNPPPESADEVIIIDCYPDNPQRTQLLQDQIERLKPFGIAIILVSHCPVPYHICESVDYVIYDKRNVKSANWEIQFKYSKPQYVKLVYSNPKSREYHGAACFSSLKNAVDLLTGRFKFAHFLEYDSRVNFELYLEKVRKFKRIGKKFVGFQYPELANPLTKTWAGPNGVGYGVFSFNLKAMKSILVEVPDWDTWVLLDPVKDLWGLSLVYEIWFYNFLDQRISPASLYYFSREDEVQMITSSEYNVEGVVHFVLSESVDHRLVLFAVNSATEQKECDLNIYGQEEKISIPAREVFYKFIDKIDGGKIFVKSGTFENNWTINGVARYGNALYLFYDQRLSKCIEWDDNLTGDFLEGAKT